MVIRHSIKILFAKNSVTRPMKYIIINSYNLNILFLTLEYIYRKHGSGEVKNKMDIKWKVILNCVKRFREEYFKDGGCGY